MARFSISGDGDGEGEGSSDRRYRRQKRRRVGSIVEDAAGDAESAKPGGSREEEGGREDEVGGSPGSDQRGEDEDEDGDDDNDQEEATMVGKRGPVTDVDPRDSLLTVTLTDPEVLDCLVCYEPLSIPIFQCDNGHIACSSCCTKLRHKCPSCSMPIGYYRCRAMERVLEAARIRCPNAIYGCTEKLPYGERSSHEKECTFTPCACPIHGCNFTGTQKHLNKHFRAKHNGGAYMFTCDEPLNFSLATNEMQVFQEKKGRHIIVVQSFGVPDGMCFTVRCISPPAPGVCEFKYSLMAQINGPTALTFTSEMKRVQRVSCDTPVESFLLVPSVLLCDETRMMLRLSISRRDILVKMI